MTDRELLELLVNKLDSMESKVGSIESSLNEFRKETNDRLDKLETKFDGLETKFDALDSKFDELEAKNAERHSELSLSIFELRKDFSRVEINTAENWIEIAKLKAAKVAERQVQDYK